MCHGGIKEIKKQTKIICEEEEEEEIMSGGSVGPLLIPANYVGCLSANQMTGTFLPSPAPYTSATYCPLTYTSTRCTAPKLWPQHCIVGHRNIAMQGQSSENLQRFCVFGCFHWKYLCCWDLSDVAIGCLKFWVFPAQIGVLSELWWVVGVRSSCGQ